MADVMLPSFELDCRDWLVLRPDGFDMPDEFSGAPLLAQLSTVVVDDDIREASGALTVGVIEDGEPLVTRPLGPDCIARELMDGRAEPGTRRYVIPTPGEQLALLAEFVIEDDAAAELDRRVEQLMASFRWHPDPV